MPLSIYKLQIITACSGAVLLILGGILFSARSTYYKPEEIIDYTNITHCNEYRPSENMTCPEYLKNNTDSEFCVCNMNFELQQDLQAPIDMFYELDSYDQSSIATSRDDKQFSGTLSPTPSDTCGNYSYVETASGKIPIAPCGALADALFNDTYYVMTLNGTEINTTATGIISDADKAGYHNPGNDLVKAFSNFTKPIHWSEPQWNVFLNKSAFENEQFIGWMTVSWKRKPYGRINQTLGAGKYRLQVSYNYPPSRYSGTRKLIFVSPTIIDVNVHLYNSGIVFMTFGIALLAFALFLYVKERRNGKTRSGERTAERPLRS